MIEIGQKITRAKTYPHELLRLVITALAIARCEPRRIKNTIWKGEKITC